MSGIHRKPTSPRKFVDLGGLTAAQPIGPLSQGNEIYGMTDGTFGLSEIISHILDEARPMHIVLCTWTAAEKSVQEFLDVIRARKVLSFRIIADPSLVTRKPEVAETMRSLYGPNCIRLVPLHAKWLVATGGSVDVTLRTSMNLNPNKRIESYEISTCPDMARFHTALADRVFSEFHPMTGKPESQSRKTLSRISGKAATPLLF